MASRSVEFGTLCNEMKRKEVNQHNGIKSGDVITLKATLSVRGVFFLADCHLGRPCVGIADYKIKVPNRWIGELQLINRNGCWQQNCEYFSAL